MQTAVQYLDMKLKKEPDGLKDGAWEELICKYKANTSTLQDAQHTPTEGDGVSMIPTDDEYRRAMMETDDTWKMPETHKTQMSKDLPSTLSILFFTGKVRFASEGRALTIEVLKTSQTNVATNSQFHITLAYHADQTFQERIVRITKEWISAIFVT